MKEEIKLNRTDDRPIAFMGEEVLSDTTRDRDSSRWYTARIFKTDDGYMVGLAHITCWPKERDQYWASEARTKKAIIKFLNDQIPEVNENEASLRAREEYVGMVDRLEKLIKSDGQIKAEGKTT